MTIMVDHQFKNGITIHIPDGMPAERLEEEWADVKMRMSLILFKPKPEIKTDVLIKTRKKLDGRKTAWTEEKKKRTSESVKAWHRHRKNKR